MPRQRGYERGAVVAAAMDVFWEQGYDRTGLSELEARTGLNRSSLYLEFGSKRQLFSAALDRYYDEVVEPLLGALEAAPGVPSIEAFFAGIKEVILDELGEERRGCMLINTIAELSPFDDGAARRAKEFDERLRAALIASLEAETTAGRIESGSVARRVGVLLASTFGVWLSARIDLEEAAARCEDIRAEVHGWLS